jgi:hypothetical protein
MGKYETARGEAHDVLRGVAREQKTIAYGQLVTRVQSLQPDPHGGVLAQILDEISTDGRGRGMLSAVVIHATDDYLPGPGFFTLAHNLDHANEDNVAFHAAELRRVHSALLSGMQRR